MGKNDRKRHKLLGLVAGITEHQPLIPGPKLFLVPLGNIPGMVDPLGDIRTLTMDRHHDFAGVRIDSPGVIHVAHASNHVSDNLLVFNLSRCGDLTGDHRQIFPHERLTGHPTCGVLLKTGIEDTIGDLIGQFIGMPRAHRLTGKQTLCHHSSTSCKTTRRGELSPQARKRFLKYLKENFTNLGTLDSDVHHTGDFSIPSTPMQEDPSTPQEHLVISPPEQSIGRVTGIPPSWAVV